MSDQAIYQVGTAIVPIEAYAGLELSGYFARSEPASSVHDQPYVRAVWIGDEDNRPGMLLVACDVIGFEPGFAEHVGATLARQLVIPQSAVVLHCTHTHSSPASMALIGCGRPDAAWLDTLAAAIYAAARTAQASPQPAHLFAAEGRCEIGYNRITGDDTHVDPSVPVLVATEPTSRVPHVVIVSHACHPVVLGPENSAISADYPGAFCRLFDAAHEGGMAVFLTGCGGDIDPRERHSFYAVEEIGSAVFQAVEEALGGELVPITGPVSSADTEPALPLVWDHTEDSLRELVNDYRSRSGEADYRDHPGDNRPGKTADGAFATWAAAMLDELVAGQLSRTVTARLTQVCIGGFSITGLPFEVFHDTGKQLRAAQGGGMVLGYTNGDFGYIPSLGLYENATYEAAEAYRYYGYPGPFAKGVAESVVETVSKLAQPDTQ